MKKLLKLISIEITVITICAIFIWFKATTNNMFLPEVPFLVFLTIFGAVFLGFGIWYEKL